MERRGHGRRHHAARPSRFIEQQQGAAVLPLLRHHDIHVPRVPHPRFAGKTTMGRAAMRSPSSDWSVGEILDTLDRLKLDRQHAGHLHQRQRPGGGRRLSGRGGGEARAPHAVRAVARRQVQRLRGRHARAVPRALAGPVKPGVSDALISEVHSIGSFAALVGSPLNDPRARDSENTLPALLGTSPKGRTVLVEQAGLLSVRQGPLKDIAPSKGPKINANTNTELGNDVEPQLYDLAAYSWRTHQSCRETTGESARARRAARRHTASWRTARSPQAPEHRPGDCRRLVVPARGNLLEMRASAHHISIASGERALASRTPSSPPHPAHHRGRRFSPARPFIVFKKAATCTCSSHSPTPFIPICWKRLATSSDIAAKVGDRYF